MIRTRIILLLALMLCTGAAGAAPQLVSMDGTRWIEPGDFHGHPVLILFWSPECPLCRIELAELTKLKAADPQAVIILAAAGPHTLARRALETYALPPDIQLARMPANPRGLLARLGNPGGALPFTVRFDGAGMPCARQTGLMNSEALLRMQKGCDYPR